MAGLGATRQDAAWLRPVRFAAPISIPLVKSDLKTSPKTRCKPLSPHFLLPADSPIPRVNVDLLLVVGEFWQ